MHERLEGLLLVALALCLGCMHLDLVKGPPLPDPGQVTAVEVTRSDGVRHTVRDPGSVRVITRSVSYREWEELKPGVPPTFRFELVSRDGSRRTYWIGANADLGSFPCYRFCSGVWLGVARDPAADGPTLKMGLADIPTFTLFEALRSH